MTWHTDFIQGHCTPLIIDQVSARLDPRGRRYAPDKGFIYTVETEIFVACTQMIQLYFQGAKYEPKSVRIITALLLFLHFLKQDRNILAQFALSIWTNTYYIILQVTK